MTTLVRPHQGRLIAGVCAGIAARFSVSVTAIRFITLVLVVFFGLSLLVYVLLWLLIPDEPYA